uniref:non-specific serine/threonine protein kinase n=1 Tax=Oryza nivara TaxID=4536 RepID=A0A0E0GXL4_ORYNI
MLPVLILFGLLFSLQRNFPACSATNNGSTLMAGQVLTGGNKLISSNSKFALGFFQTGSSKQGGQSFDHPTDVFLPGVKIGQNKITGQKYSFTSKKNSEDPALGLYCMELDPSGSRQYYDMLCNSSIVYFSTGEWNGRYFNSVPEMSSNGFSVKSPKDWELDDRREGCTRNIPLGCSSNESTTGLIDKFFPIPSIRLPYDAHSISMETVASAHECIQVCLRNCSCTAYSHGRSGCSVWHEQLINVKQYNGTSNTNEENFYHRLAAAEVPSWGQNRREKIIAVVVGASFLGLPPAIDDLEQKEVTYDHLQCATKNFSEKLGGGGFGSIFKGILSDSNTIAVKMLDGARQGEKQFRAEVVQLG